MFNFLTNDKIQVTPCVLLDNPHNFILSLGDRFGVKTGGFTFTLKARSGVFVFIKQPLCHFNQSPVRTL